MSDSNKDGKMTKHDLEKLLQLERNESKALKSATEARRAQVVAEGESHIARKYQIDRKPEWLKLFRQAQEIIDKLNATIVEDLKQEGLPKTFAPCALISWSDRGENAIAERRAELRRVLTTQAVADQKTACIQIDLWSVKSQRELLACGLATEAARAILARRPTLEQLVPTLKLADLEQKLDADSKAKLDGYQLPWDRR